MRGAARDPGVHVINTSLGSIFDAAWLNTAQGQLVAGVVDLARTNGKIWAASAGNTGERTDPATRGHYPSDFAPDPAARGANDNLMLSVGATATENQNTGPERLWGSRLVNAVDASNHGPRLSVVAAGDNVVLPDHDGSLQLRGGTSMASPAVAGLAAEMRYLDLNRPGGSRLTPLQIIELIEATADDLGTTVTGADVVRPNDRPANGRDDFFGSGRINVWKALLAVANGGTATNKATEFPSLRGAVTPDDQTWFGFAIQSPVFNATLWIDDKQVQDPQPVQSTGNAGGLTDKLSAYKGVESARIIQRGIDVNGDGVPDEDPTSDVVPVGVPRGEFIATFSIQRGDLRTCAKEPCTLSLRRPKQTVDDAPFWNLRLELDKMMNNAVPGVVFDDWVFEITPTDFGDAVSPYPSRLRADNGARALNSNLEWFGPNTDTGLAESDDWLMGVSPEPNADNEPGGPDADVDPDGTRNIMRAADLDRFDTGVVFYPRTYAPGGTGRVDFTVCVADHTSLRYAGDADRALWVNGWIDWNTNNAWEEGATREHVVSGARINPRGDWAVAGAGVSLLRKSGNCATFKATFALPATIGTGKLWARFHLDYGENVGRNDPRPDNKNKHNWRSDPSLRDPTLGPREEQKPGKGIGFTQGASRFGEIEDYLIGTDYGDAPDPPYPTLHAGRGAFSLNFTREWLGQDDDYARATRELDGCDRTTSEEDRDAKNAPVPNLGGDCKDRGAALDGKDDGVVVPGSLTPATDAVVKVTVTSQIDTRGFANRGPGGQDSATVMTLKEDCTLGPILDTDPKAKNDTPMVHRDRGRYAAWDARRRLYLNAWVDWNANGSWDDEGEYIIQHRPVDPEDFGKDGKYTLGEPFEDRNHDGVFTPGVDRWEAAEHDVAGRPSRTFTCTVKVPESVSRDKPVYWRFRLDYGEDVTEQTGVVRSAALQETEKRNLSLYRGGSWWGEVEDYVTPPPPPGIPQKRSTPSSVPPNSRIRYTIDLPAAATLTAPVQAFIRDPLPREVQFAGNLTCTTGACGFDAATSTVAWQGTLGPGQTVTVAFDVTVPELPSCPPTVTNTATAFDGVTTHQLSVTTTVQCPTPTVTPTPTAAGARARAPAQAATPPTGARGRSEVLIAVVAPIGKVATGQSGGAAIARHQDTRLRSLV